MAEHDIIDRFFRALKHSPFIMIGLDDTPDHSQPMTAQTLEDRQDALWFFASRDNRLAIGGPAMAQFVSKGHDFFACLHGILSADEDRAMIDRLWSKQVEAWFPGGKEDPKLLLLRYDMESAELWEGDVSLTGQVKMLFGGTIKPSEAGEHAEVSLG
ncbi:MAG: general stress protein [Proteobacteria bacterium SG_bin6]|nr:MAG: general stress protein [Proteobacteria bacterium SG_bin6]